ncbi:prostatic acid phosphatase-like [Atheta coriaria]|uniref:prostatic acid phosphatase-like n=1 Tax=Dalotia coriaria TaxID=877792 RepID=UPI0031F46F20
MTTSQKRKKMRNYFTVFAVLAVLLAGFIIYVCAPGTETLQLVHVLFRHGERSPSSSYTNDPYKNHKWPGGWDQLSITGKKQEYALGLELRRRYQNFLQNEYDPRVFLMESSYADRCLMSAQLLLAGLFPPSGGEIWNENLRWQPIPVHSVPRNMDNKIAIKRSCPAFQRALNESYASLAESNVENRQLYDYLSENTGDEIRDIRTLETLYNTLEIEQLNGFQLPEWTNSVFPSKMKDLAASSLALFTKTIEMKRLHGGVLAKEILTNMEMKALQKLTPNRKMIMYSGHDLTIVTLMRVFGFPELIKPDFGATVIIELHKYTAEEDHIVKFFYLENPNGKATELHLEGCRQNGCHLTRVKELLQPVLPENWEQECQI